MLKWFADRLARTGKKVSKDEKGFTLIELLVVVIIIGILAAIAIPVFLSQRADAESRSAQANVRTAGTAEQAAYTKTGSYVGVSALGSHGFNSQGVTPAVTGGGSGNTYCISSTGGGQTWRMTQDMGSPATGAAC